MIKQIISCIPEVLLQMGKNSNEKILLCINLFMIIYALFAVKLVQKYENKKWGEISLLNIIITYSVYMSAAMSVALSFYCHHLVKLINNHILV